MDPSSRLPLELLQKVFQHYLSDRETPVQSFDHSDGLWVIGQVNSTWRNATLSNASFWSAIHATFAYPPDPATDSSDRDASRLSRPVDLAAIFNGEEIDDSRYNGIRSVVLTNGVIQSLGYILSRSRDIPLSVYIRFPIQTPQNMIPPTWRTFFSLLTAESSRVQCLDLIVPTPIWDDLAIILPSRFQILQKLHATIESGPEFTPVISCCPTLLDLAIRTVHRSSASRINDATRVNYSSIPMPHLHRLELVYASSFLHSMHAQNLKSLTLICNYIEAYLSHASPLADFLHRSKCALTDLDLFWRGSVDELLTILSRIPTLESFTCRSDLNTIFYERMKSPSTILPRLRAFSLQTRESITRLVNLSRGTRPVADATSVIDMVESRLSGGVLQSVDIRYIMVDYLSEGSKRRLSNLNATPCVAVEIEKFSDDLVQSRIRRYIDAIGAR
ncbi:hypothetical protein ARMSODRAFT_961522 [Armillaria solidipes]|uniref:F-box domain-containing protein n=1 Tax=Armillaria solidipes TaxID=1076256 RepID=A0A2H3BD17_9AGAR|nr:hypothetical protein ARMSODRAFT_961522 [Armillaria solidipes]